MGELGRKGTLEKGKDADICFYDQDVQLHFVMQQGKIIVG
jgi:N-acetylglucosamine-6-phosphate deacetylase